MTTSVEDCIGLPSPPPHPSLPLCHSLYPALPTLPYCSFSMASALTSLTATTPLPCPVKVSLLHVVCSCQQTCVSPAAWAPDCEEVTRSFEQVLNLLLRSSRSLPEDRRNVRDQHE